MLKRAVRPFVLAMLVSACAGRGEQLTPAASREPAPRAAGPKIQTYSSLQALMMRGRTDAAIALASVRRDPALVGLGSLSELRGEVLIFDGEIWLGYSEPDGTSHANEIDVAHEGAAFLVTAHVPRWQPLELTQTITFEELEPELERLARGAGLDPTRPFPLVIEGRLANLAYNVANGRAFPPGQEISRDALLAASPKRQLAAADGVIVGFFSKSSTEAFLHPGVHFHLHVLLRDDPQNPQVGHVDGVDLTPGTKLRLPAPG